MKLLLAGGVFRLTEEQRRTQQPTPETTLATGLSKAGVAVDTCALEERLRIFTARRYDVIHVHHASKAAVLATLRPSSTPIVFTPHSIAEPASIREQLGLRKIVLSVSRLVCLSDAEAEWYTSRFPGVEGRISVIPNGIRPLLPDVPKRSWGAEDFTLLFVGQLIGLKRVDVAIRALAATPNTRLRLVYHNAAMERELMALAERLGVWDRVDFLGRLAGEDLATEYRHAHALVLPSLHEALPSVVTEAVQLGLPVLGSDVGGIRKQVGDAGIVFGPHVEGALNGALKTMMQNYVSYVCASVTRAHVVRDDYSVTRMIEAHLDLYDRLVAA